jgi:hypothetical protein
MAGSTPASKVSRRHGEGSPAANRYRAGRARPRPDRVRRGERSLRAAIRHWEDSTYRGYDSIVRNLAISRRQERSPIPPTRRAGPSSACRRAGGGSTAARGMRPIPTPSGTGTCLPTPTPSCCRRGASNAAPATDEDAGAETPDHRDLLLAGREPLAGQSAAPNTLASRTLGSSTAPITVYEMSDFQCPYCRRFSLETFPALERDTSPPARSAGSSSTSRSRRCTRTRSPRRRPRCARPSKRVLAGARPALQAPETWAPLKEPAAFFLSLADSAKISKPALLECVRSPATRAEVRAEAEGRSSQGHRARRRSTSRADSGRCASAAGVPAGAGFDLSGEGQQVGRRSSPRASRGPLHPPTPPSTTHHTARASTP